MKISSLKTSLIDFSNGAALLQLTFLALIPAWALGVDQIYWYALIPFMLISIWKSPLAENGGRIWVGLVAVFLLLQLVSVRNVENAFRLVTFSRNWLTDVSCLLCFLAIAFGNYSTKSLLTLARTVAFVGGLICTLGVVGIFFSEQVVFNAAIYHLIPDSLKNVQSVALLYKKGLGGFDWWFSDTVVRVNSIFKHPTSYALGLLSLIGLKLMLFSRSTSAGRIWLSFGLVLCGINLIFSWTRGAWAAAFLGGAAVFALLFLVGFTSTIRKWMISFGLLAAAVVLVLVAPSKLTDRLENIPDRIETRGTKMKSGSFLLARGGGSMASRKAIYVGTLSDLKTKPVLGWGTQRSTLDFTPYPAGSHSTYLGYLYKFGVLGLASYLLIYFAIFFQFLAGYFSNRLSTEGAFTLIIGLSFFLASCAHQVLEEITLDTSVGHIFWVVTGIFLGLTRNSLRNPAEIA